MVIIIPNELHKYINIYSSCRSKRILHQLNKKFSLIYLYSFIREGNIYTLDRGLVYNEKGHYALILFSSFTNDCPSNITYCMIRCKDKNVMSKILRETYENFDLFHRIGFKWWRDELNFSIRTNTYFILYQFTHYYFNPYFYMGFKSKLWKEHKKMLKSIYINIWFFHMNCNSIIKFINIKT